MVLLHADRSVLAEHDSTPDAAAEALSYIMDRLYHETYDVFKALIGQRPVAMLGEVELLQMTATALDVLAARQSKEQLRAANGHANGRAPSPAPPSLHEGRLQLVPARLDRSRKVGS